MAITFWSDPHLGLRRNSHTTPASRERLREAVFLAASRAADMGPSVCLGDLFDTTDNEEADIALGNSIVANTHYVLAGNHDLPNREGKLSSLELIKQVNGDPGNRIVVGNPTTVTLQGYKLALVPHQPTQERFEECLAAVAAVGGDVLCLHCNYESGFVGNDYTLNLSREQAEFLLQSFRYVLLGHEHEYRSAFNGRLQILGNVHPTSFADIGNKFVWTLDDKGLRPTQVWDRKAFAEIPWNVLNTYSYTELEHLQFIDVVGEAPASAMPAIAKEIQQVWSIAPHLLMLRNSVKVLEERREFGEITSAQDVPSRISNDLKGTELEQVWHDYLGRLK
jgi:DNA repair exonuclease SbcCD nuclease subunit